MNMTLLLLLCQADDVQLKELKGYEVRAFAEVANAGDPPIVQLLRKHATMKGSSTGKQKIGERWGEEFLAFPAPSQDRWKVDVRLTGPGWYLLRVADRSYQIGVSRTGFEGWNRDLEELRRLSGKLTTAAQAIDQAGPGSAAVFERWNRNLMGERAKLAGLRTEFEASAEMIRSGIDRLRFHRVLLKYANNKVAGTGEEDEYSLEMKKDAGGVPSAVDEVAELSAFITNELSLKLLDELLLVLSQDAGSRRLIRWPSTEAALQAITRAGADLGASPELAELLKRVPKEPGSPQADAFRTDAAALRARLVE